MSYGKIGLTTVAVNHDLLSGMPLLLLLKELISLWNSILPEPGQPSAQLSKLIRLTACKKTKHIVSRWYRTAYIPWLVASYDTYKGKRWLNSDPPKPQGRKLQIMPIRSTYATFAINFYILFCRLILPKSTFRPDPWFIILEDRSVDNLYGAEWTIKAPAICIVE